MLHLAKVDIDITVCNKIHCLNSLQPERAQSSHFNIGLVVINSSTISGQETMQDLQKKKIPLSAEEGKKISNITRWSDNREKLSSALDVEAC